MVTCAEQLEALDDLEALKDFDLVVPNWSMGQPTPEQTANFVAAVRDGTGLGGIHGGMGDAFRGHIEYEWMAGGHFVGHPTVGEYEIRKTAISHPITTDLPQRFTYNSEQYYMMVDPVIEVLAETDYIYEGKRCTMPVVWTRQWGKGRVFYSALGHEPAEFERFPAVLEMSVRGLLWAARSL